MRGLRESSRGWLHVGARTSCPPERSSANSLRIDASGRKPERALPAGAQDVRAPLVFTIYDLPFTIIVSDQGVFMTVPFLEDNDQTQARREHLESLRQLVGNVYPNKFERSNVTENPSGEDTITSIAATFKKFEPQTAEGQKPSVDGLEAANTQLNKVHVRIAGRIAAPPRVMGKAAFVHLSDGTSRLQIYVRRQDITGVRNDADGGEVNGWELFNLLDHGDFIGVEGYLFVTRTGELSVHVEKLQFLAKALLPMPDKMHGIHDAEIRQRQRYADLIAGSLKLPEKDDDEREEKPKELNSRQVFQLRSRAITTIRAFLDAHDFVEVETPMLTALATGAAARPFKTRHNALGIDLYARIAPELYLKRLLVGGFERVYELNRNFRNEGISSKHNPEFTMLEFYMAYADVNQMMDFCETMLRETVKKVTGKTILQLKRESWVYKLFGLEEPPDTIEINFEKEFKRISMRNAICEYWNSFAVSEYSKPFSIGDISPEWLEDAHNVGLLVSATKTLLVNVPFENKVSFLEPRASVDHKTLKDFYEKKESIEQIRNVIFSEAPVLQDEIQLSRAIEFLFEEIVEKHLTDPTFIIDYPKAISPLSKASPSNPAIAERFEFFVGGLETGNGFSELNDPKEQEKRFLDQMQQRDRGDEEAMVMDEDYIRALSYGMPPAAGIGIGIDRLIMLLANKQSIRDVIMFPHMRPERRADDEGQAGQ
jgi:lysyl-tRNA synthetase, class II